MINFHPNKVQSSKNNQMIQVKENNLKKRWIVVLIIGKNIQNGFDQVKFLGLLTFIYSIL